MVSTSSEAVTEVTTSWTKSIRLALGNVSLPTGRTVGKYVVYGLIAAGISALIASSPLPKLVLELKDRIWAGFRNYFMNLLCSAKHSKSRSRRIINSLMNVKLSTKVDPSKPHPKAAGARAEGTARMLHVIKGMGLKPYFFQLSSWNVRNKHEGTTKFTVAKDIDRGKSEHQDAVTSSHVIVLIDDDYYEDLEEVLISNPENIHVMYSFTPSAAGKVTTDYKYHFDKDGKVVYEVFGGAKFEHSLHNLSNDSLTTKPTWRTGNWSYSFLVERFQVDEDHSVFWFIPLSKMHSLTRFVFPDRYELYSRKFLKPFNPIVHGLTRDHVFFRIMNESGTTVTIGTPGMNSAIVVAEDVFTNAYSTSISSAGVLTKGTLKAVGFEENETSLGICFLRDTATCTDLTQHFRLPASTTYTFGHFEENPKPVSVPFMQPWIIGEVLVPNNDAANTEHAVSSRMLAFNNPVEPTPFILQCFEEFLSLIGDECGVSQHALTPVDMEYLLERQRRPNQRRMVMEADEALGKDGTVTGFMKGEVYKTEGEEPSEKPDLLVGADKGRPKDTRCIINYPASAKCALGPFVYALSEKIKECSFYSFVEPSKLNKRLLSMRAAALEMSNDARPTEGDAKRFDGHVNLTQRILELMALYYFFDTTYHAEIDDAMDKDASTKVHMKYDIIWYLLWKRGSGSMLTSLMNTILSAFMRYLGGRLNPKGNETGRALTPKEAYSNIGNIGGDDTLFWEVENYPVCRYIRAAAILGHKMEVAYPEYPSFLGRRYGGLKGGSTSSCAAPERVLFKLHMTNDKLATPETKILEKALAIAATDKYTPIIGIWASKVIEILKPQMSDLEKLKESRSDISQSLYLALMDEDPIEEMQPEKLEDWMSDVWNKELAGFNIEKFITDLNQCVILDDLLIMGPYKMSVMPSTIELMTEDVNGAKKLNKKNSKSEPKLSQHHRKVRKTFKIDENFVNGRGNVVPPVLPKDKGELTPN
jgi:hypothetical protein